MTHATRRTFPAQQLVPGLMLIAAAYACLAAAPAVGAIARPGVTDGRDSGSDGDHGGRPAFNRRGNVLISDQFNNRVIEITPKGDIVWQYGIGPNDVSALSPIGVNDAQRVGDNTLLCGTGAPAGTEPNCPGGCADNRVLLVDRMGHIQWQYGQFGVTGSEANELNTPVQATWLPSAHVLITDQGNQRVIEVDRSKHIVWQYGTTGVSGSGPNQLDSPNSGELLANGHVLIADENNNRAIEVDSRMKIIATFTASGSLGACAFASRLGNGHTLLTDAGNNRIVEVDRHDAVVWQYVTNLEPGSNPNPAPTRGLRLRNGNTIISDQFNHRVIVVDPRGSMLVRYGTLNVAGFGATNANQGLNGPYDAKVIGDFTGITPPGGERDGDEAEDHDNAQSPAPMAQLAPAGQLPRALALSTPQPNPSRGNTAIVYALPHSANVSLAVFDLTGRRVRTLVQGPIEAGEHTVSFALADGQGRRLSLGLYFVRLEAEGRVLTTRLVATR